MSTCCNMSFVAITTVGKKKKGKNNQQKLKMLVRITKHSLSNEALYGTTNVFQLPFSSLKKRICCNSDKRNSTIERLMDIKVKAA